jgi:hypothetical protein
LLGSKQKLLCHHHWNLITTVIAVEVQQGCQVIATDNAVRSTKARISAVTPDTHSFICRHVIAAIAGVRGCFKAIEVQQGRQVVATDKTVRVTKSRVGAISS